MAPKVGSGAADFPEALVNPSSPTKAEPQVSGVAEEALAVALLVVSSTETVVPVVALQEMDMVTTSSAATVTAGMESVPSASNKTTKEGTLVLLQARAMVTRLTESSVGSRTPTSELRRSALLLQWKVGRVTVAEAV